MAEHATTPPGHPAIEALRRRLDASRTRLLHALTGLTERDFTAAAPDTTPGESTVLDLLVSLMLAEHAAVEAIRRAVDMADRRSTAPAASPGDRILPPQVTHGLAGARRGTLALLDELGQAGLVTLDSPLASTDDQSSGTVRTAIEAIAAREEAAAAAIAARRSAG